jgi:hypothetical protein
MKRSTLALLIAACLPLAASACGGGEGSSGAASLPKPVYVKRAHAICKKGRDYRAAALRAANRGLKPGQALSERAARQYLSGVVIPSFQQTLAKLRSLPAPAGDQEKVMAYLKAFEGGIGELKNEPFSPKLQRATELMAEYGLTDCGF